MASLQEIRARLAAQDKKSFGNFDNATYPHWNIAEGTSCRVRFLPDGDNKNDFFWAERLMIKLPFNGIKGTADNKRIEIQVPCMDMWNEPCPILAEVRPWWKDESLKDLASKYWKKKSYIMQGFVRENPIAEDASKERTNPISKFIIGPQIYTLIKGALIDPELENLPTDYQNGLDFVIAKTSKGGYSDYNTSKWARKESPLTQTELDAIEQHGLFDLSTFLPKKPTEVEIKVMKEMFEASVDGQPYDGERWAKYFKPFGYDDKSTTNEASETSAPVVDKSETKATVEKTEEQVEVKAADENKSKASSDRAAAIIASIRARQTK